MKSFFVFVGRGKKYASIAFRKPLNKGEYKQCAKEIMDIARERNVKGLLVDTNGVKCISSANEKFVFANTDLDVINFDRLLKVAILADKDDHSYNHLEAMCYMAGYQIKVFRNKDMALKWLDN